MILLAWLHQQSSGLILFSPSSLQLFPDKVPQERILLFCHTELVVFQSFLPQYNFTLILICLQMHYECLFSIAILKSKSGRYKPELKGDGGVESWLMPRDWLHTMLTCPNVN